MAGRQALINMNSTSQHVSIFETISQMPSHFLKDVSETHVMAVTLASFSSMLTWTNLSLGFLLVFILLNFKAFPLVYHLRILNAIRFVLKSQKPKVDVRPEQLFQPLITSSKACLMEIDVLGHKSNSTYFADVDIARMHLLITLFARGIEKIRGGTTMNALSGKAPSKLTIALGGVSCTFKKELLPYETYDMWTRILCWDDKWIYIVTHFVKRQPYVKPQSSTLYPQQDSKSSRQTSKKSKISSTSAQAPPPALIAASALSKVVWKNGKITVRPQEMLENAKLLPKACEDMDEVEREKLSQAIETERLRGLQQANLLGEQIGLHNELRTDVALGSHFDGMGVEGVVATLGQLGKISPYQLI